MKMIMGWIGVLAFVTVLNAGEVDQNIKRMFDLNDVKYTINSDNDFQLPFKDGNNVIVTSSVEDYRELTVREIWAILDEVGKRNKTLLYSMLIENFKKKIGAYSLVSRNDKIYAIYRVTLPAKASWDELWSAILFCANQKLPE